MEATVEEILTRGTANIIPGKKELKTFLSSHQKGNAYLGIDPTSPHIHLGHAFAIRKLQKLVEIGMNVTLLIGDFTSLVGDTSDKESERPILTEQEIEKNFQTYKKQTEKLLDFSKVKIRHNSEWLEKLTYKSLLKLKQQFSLNDFISRELIKKRLEANKHIRLDETEYPIMQGYDSYYLDTDLQIGGTDQTFNMQAGRTLQKNLRHKESYILTTEFLTGTDGRKMSKSWGNAIWMDDTPEDMYIKTMAIKDDLTLQYYTLATNESLKNINSIAEDLNHGGNPMSHKKNLALKIVTEIYSHDAALKAQDNFEKTIQKKEIPADIAQIKINKALTMENISMVLLQTGLVESKAEAKRLIEQGGISLNENKINDSTISINKYLTKNEILVKIGRKKFAKLVVDPS